MSLEGCTALHFAASEGKSQSISNILRAGNVDVNAQAEVCSFCRNGAAQKGFVSQAAHHHSHCRVGRLHCTGVRLEVTQFQPIYLYNQKPM